MVVKRFYFIAEKKSHGHSKVIQKETSKRPSPLFVLFHNPLNRACNYSITPWTIQAFPQSEFDNHIEIIVFFPLNTLLQYVFNWIRIRVLSSVYPDKRFNRLLTVKRPRNEYIFTYAHRHNSHGCLASSKNRNRVKRFSFGIDRFGNNGWRTQRPDSTDWGRRTNEMSKTQCHEFFPWRGR